MAYNVFINVRAQAEIEEAIDWYAEKSKSTPPRFIKALQVAYSSLQTNPYFQVRYKNVRAITLRNFPYSLFFTIDKPGKTVRVLSCFHNHRNPSALP